MAKRKPAGKKRGPKEKPIDLATVQKLSSQGLNWAQVAGVIGFSEGHLYARAAKAPEIAEAYKAGRSKGVLQIANKLFEGAQAGNVTSQIFYLKCMGGWRENKRIEITGADGGPVQIEKRSAIETLIEELAKDKEREEGEGDS